MARLFSFSERIATARVVMKAKAYGGIVRSWALAAVYPSDLIMLGCSHSQQICRGNEKRNLVTHQEERIRI